MDEIEQPQIYLITPPEFELEIFPDRLAQVLDAHEVACLRLSLATRDEDRIARAADACREVTHPKAAVGIEPVTGMAFNSRNSSTTAQLLAVGCVP